MALNRERGHRCLLVRDCAVVRCHGMIALIEHGRRRDRVRR